MAIQSVLQNHKELLSALITKLETDERRFYERASNWNNFAWHLTAGIAFLSSVFSSLTAALMDKGFFEAWGKSLLIVVPGIGAVAAGLLHLYKFREKEALREEGRIELNDIIDNAKSLLASATNEDDYKLAFHSVRDRFRLLELSQHRRDIALRSDEIPKMQKQSEQQ